MPDIPEEAVRAADLALEAHFEGGCDALEFTCSARAAVEAAAPVLAEHIARLIRAQRPAGNTQLTWEGGIKRAARVAREAFTAGEWPGGTAPKSGPGSPQGDATRLSGLPHPPERSEALTDAHSASGSEGLRRRLVDAKLAGRKTPDGYQFNSNERAADLALAVFVGEQPGGGDG